MWGIEPGTFCMPSVSLCPSLPDSFAKLVIDANTYWERLFVMKIFACKWGENKTKTSWSSRSQKVIQLQPTAKPNPPVVVIGSSTHLSHNSDHSMPEAAAFSPRGYSSIQYSIWPESSSRHTELTSWWCVIVTFWCTGNMGWALGWWAKENPSYGPCPPEMSPALITESSHLLPRTIAGGNYTFLKDLLHALCG